MPGLIVLALIAGFFGVIFASQATVGVALVGIACLFAILARMRQAHVYRYDLDQAIPPVWAMLPTKPNDIRLNVGQRVPLTTAQRVAVAVLIAIFVGAAYAGLVFGQS